MSFCNDDSLYEHDDAPFLREDIRPKFELLGVSHELEEDIQSVDIQNDVTALLGVRGSVIIRESEGNTVPLRATVRQGYKMFLHPKGLHALVSTLDGHLHYFNIKTKRANTTILLQQMGGASSPAGGAATAANVAECVYWGSSSDPKTTDSILVGTRTGGTIFELRFEFLSGETSVTCRSVLTIPGAASTPVTGIDAVTLKDETVVVMITTPTKMCRIEGAGDARRAIVENAKSMLVTDMPTSSDNPARGSLCVFRSVLGGQAQSYAWSSASGVVHGLFAQRAPIDSEDAEDLDVDLDSLVNQHLIALHRRSSAGQSTATKLGIPDRPPTEVILSAFHMVLLFDDRVIVLNHPAGLSWRPLNGQDLQEDDISDRIKFDPFRYRKVRRLQGVFRDVAQRKIYLYNATNIWELLIEHEHFTQWRLFLERAIDPTDEISLRKRFYAAAYNLSKHNKYRRDLVAYSRGMFYLYQLKDPESATSLLAACDRFEEIYVQLTQQKSVAVLRKFLEKRYVLLIASGEASKPAHKAQVACLIMHLVQLKLDNISKCEGDQARTAAAVKDLDDFLTATVRRNPDIFQDQSFYHMIAAAITCQGRIPTMLHFAELLQRVHYTINFHLSQREYRQACELLIRYGTKESSVMADAWYDFAPIIIENCPVRLITGLLRAVIRHSDGTQEHLLDIERLIPAFIRYHPKLNEVPNNSEHQVILFLERCIEKLNCVSPVVHNFYVSLLVQHDSERLLDFFNTNDEERPQYYSTEFALRRCLELHRFQHCIPLYKKLGLYEDAIGIAMEISAPDASGRWEGLQDAKTILREADEFLDFATKKKLWMMVAERVIEKIGTRQALSIVEESSGVLKLEDVLAKINDNTVIQNFKEAVCRSLDEYTTAISDLNQEQREAFQMSESVKREIRELKNRYGFVTSKQKCHLCQKGLLQGASPFLVFPGCRHVFHEGCVVRRLESLGGLEAFRNSPELPAGYLDGIYSLDDLAQSECVFCGECAILEITQDFFEEGADPSWSTD